MNTKQAEETNAYKKISLFAVQFLRYKLNAKRKKLQELSQLVALVVILIHGNLF